MKLYMTNNDEGWFTSDLMDITSDVKIDSLSLIEKMGAPHQFSVTLVNNKKKYTKRSSRYSVFVGKKLLFHDDNKQYKLIISDTPVEPGENLIRIMCLSHSFKMSTDQTQIRSPLGADSKYTLEDTLYAALFDTGMHNMFDIYMPDGMKYEPWNILENSIPMDNKAPIYIGTTILEVLNDLCGKLGITWYEKAIDHPIRSEIHLVKLLNDYESTPTNVLAYSTYDDTVDVTVSRDLDSIVNTIYLMPAGITIPSVESIKRDGKRTPLSISLPEDYDIDKVIDLSYKYLSISTEPDTTINVTIGNLLKLDSIDYFIKVMDRFGGYDENTGVDIKYRLIQIKYDYAKNETTLLAGTTARNIVMDTIKEAIEGKSNDETDETLGYAIAKYDTSKIFIYSDRDKWVDPIDPSTDYMYSPVIGVDSFYLDDMTEDHNTKIYMDGDGRRRGP